MKSTNKSSVLNLIRVRGPISRADIAKITKLTPPTVSTIVAELLTEDIIYEKQGTGKATGGRKPFMLSLSDSSYYVVGVYAAAEVVHTVLSNLKGDIVSEKKSPVPDPATKDQFLRLLDAEIKNQLEQNNITKQSVLGIGVAMHGLVDPDKGIALFSPHLNLENIPVKEYLEERIKVPVLIENDVRALSLAESWYGEGQEVSDFICLSVGLGVGSGIFINNDIYKGPYNTSGEIGHTIVDVNGPRCRCGNYGCLEAFASEYAVVNKIKKDLRLGKTTLIRDWLNDERELTFDLVMKAADQGDRLACDTLQESGRFLGIAIANLYNLLTPSKIILEGRIFKAGEMVLEPMKQMIKQCSIQHSINEDTIVLSRLGKKGMVVGAYTLVLRELFTPGIS
ncbi:ROK family transcriptional regulator [Alteribacter keqinensis]|nr:ROK family transcriptional regulator [Alteribacter keqinensis]